MAQDQSVYYNYYALFITVEKAKIISSLFGTLFS